ncbi:MAG: hypothetical protein GWN93_06715 [Deltaproteobacteria bacterium]|nr:hypothetical protein [Deltaproteobacteria bacterium]
MGQKLYHTTEKGGISFKTERRVGDVRIPNYVYDLWLPIIGAVGIGVYGVYCRLEREGIVKAMTQKRIAQMCHIGVNRLRDINDMLQRLGFIRIKKPEGHERLMHWTTEITVLDAPMEVSEEVKPLDYETFSPWLVECQTNDSENPDESSEEPEQILDENPDESSKVASLGLNPLEVVTEQPEKDYLTDVFAHKAKAGKLKLPHGWSGASEGEFAVCQRVSDLWRGGTFPRRSDEIDKQIAGAAELLAMHDGDVKATLTTIDTFHATEDGEKLWVAGPQSLTNMLPNFIARSQNGTRLKVGR